MKYKIQACLCFTLKTMQAGLPAETGLRQQTIGKDPHDEQLNKKEPEFFDISQQILLHILVHQKRPWGNTVTWLL
jgi:hypothetical protein